MLADDTALIFEGGAMRNAYTAAVVTVLVREGITFPKAYGISAGAALAAFYASRNPERARATFTDAVQLPRAGGPKELFEGEGFFDLQYVLDGLSEMHANEDDEWTFDYQQFAHGPTDIHIEAFDICSGETVAWTRADMHTMTDVMERVRASCSYPLFTPATEIGGRKFADGGMGTSHGICLDAARNDGFERFFIVRTQPRDYRMPHLSAPKREAYRVAYRKHPAVSKALEERPAAYNRLLDEISDLREAGTAYVFCPDTMPITYKTINHQKLCDAYQQGLNQCERELPAWIRFLRRG